MSHPAPPPASPRVSTSWWLAAVLVVAPLAAEMGHTCLGPLSQEGRGGLAAVASSATATAKLRSTCPGCLHHLQGVGAMPVPLHLPGPGSVGGSPLLAPPAVVAGTAVDSAPARAPPRF
ncbi:MAG: hypothetical protein HRF46_14675 [Acidobacteriota bacterium]